MNKKEVNRRFTHYNFFPKSRKGSHVGVILSLTIFIMFLLGLFFAIQPLLKNQKENEVLLDKLEAKLLGEISNNLTVATISTASGTWLRLGNSDIGVSGDGAIVKEDDGTEIVSGYDGSNLIIQAGSQPALWVYYAEEFNINQETDNILYISPTIKSIRQTTEYFEKKIENTLNNYEMIKNSMNLPQDNGFGYSFQYNNGTIVNAGINNSVGNVYVQEIPIRYINGSANSLSGKLIIRAW